MGFSTGASGRTAYGGQPVTCTMYSGWAKNWSLVIAIRSTLPQSINRIEGR